MIPTADSTIDITRHAETIYRIVADCGRSSFTFDNIHRHNSELHTWDFPILVDGQERNMVVESNIIINYTNAYMGGMVDGKAVDLKAYLTLNDKFLIEAHWRGASIMEIPENSGPTLVIKYLTHAFSGYRFAHAADMTQEEFDHLMVTAKLMIKAT